MQLTFAFVTSVIPVLFLGQGAAARGMSPHEYYKHVKAIENWGGAKEVNNTAGGNTTTVAGQICYIDLYYEAFHAFLPDVIPFCRSWLPIPDLTVTTVQSTILSTYTTIVTRTYDDIQNTATVPELTTTATATSTSYFAVPPEAPTVTLAPRADARHIKALKQQAVCTDTSIISGISSACLCLGLSPVTTEIYATTTKTVTLSGFIWERGSTVVTRTTGVVTVTRTVPLYLPSTSTATIIASSSAGRNSSTTVTATVTIPAISTTSSTSTQVPSSLISPTTSRILTTVTTTGIFGRPTTVTEIIENNRTITLHESTTTTTTVYETIYPGESSSPGTTITSGNFTTTTTEVLDPDLSIVTETSKTTISLTETARTTVLRPPPTLSFGTGSRTISVITTTGVSGQPTTVTLEIGNNYTSTLSFSTTATTTIYATIYPPSWAGNSTTLASTGTGPSSGFPVSTATLVSNSSVAASTTIPASSGWPTPYPNSTTSFSTAPGTAPFPSSSPITFANLTTTAVLTVPITITAPESVSYSISTAPNGSSTSYPFYDSIESGIIIIPWTSKYTSVQTLTSVSVGATTSYWTSTHPQIWPNGTGAPSYSIVAPTVSTTVTVPLSTGPVALLPLPTTTVELGIGLLTEAPASSTEEVATPSSAAEAEESSDEEDAADVSTESTEEPLPPADDSDSVEEDQDQDQAQDQAEVADETEADAAAMQKRSLHIGRFALRV